MLNDINKSNEDNLGGVLLFKFIPVEDVDTIVEPIEGYINKEITLLTRKRWFDFYGTQGTMGFSEDQVYSPQGSYYKKRLVAITPKIRTDLDALFHEMRNRQFILDVIDSNGLRKIVGSKTEPLLFTKKSDTKTGQEQRNEYAIEFSGEGLNQSYTYNV